MLRRWLILTLLSVLVVAAGCSGGDAADGGRGGPPGGRGGGPPGGGGRGGGSTAVPVEVARVERRTISSYIETNGTLEAENEVDLVARVSAPVIQLLAEEGLAVRKGQTLARLEQVELKTQLEISRVALNEATLAYERAKKLHTEQLIPEEEFERAKSTWESATAQLQATEIQLAYTEIKAPFGGLIVTRYVDLAQQVSVNTPLFRISDFTPLLCPIQVPERELSRLASGQPAYILVEPWPGHRFEARVLRISPVVDAATGTIKVTLEVEAENKLRPGMFARVFVETETRENAVVIPKSALSLESIGDTVYVADGDVASRREVELGFRDGDFVEVVDGVAADELIVVVGHDGLSDGTPIEVLGGEGYTPPVATAEAEPPPGGRPGDASARGPGGRSGEGGPRGPGGRSGGRPDFSKMTPEQLERAREFMRARGMTDEQIEARISGERGSSERDSR